MAQLEPVLLLISFEATAFPLIGGLSPSEACFIRNLLTFADVIIIFKPI